MTTSRHIERRKKYPNFSWSGHGPGLWSMQKDKYVVTIRRQKNNKFWNITANWDKSILETALKSSDAKDRAAILIKQALLQEIEDLRRAK